MGYRCTAYVWEMCEEKGTNKLAMLAIANFANDETGVGWPSHASLARMCSTGKRNIITVLKVLEEKKLISVRIRSIQSHTQGGIQSTNLYYLNGYKEWKQLHDAINNKEKNRRQGSDPQITTPDKGSDPQITKVVIPRSPEPLLEPELNTLPSPAKQPRKQDLIFNAISEHIFGVKPEQAKAIAGRVAKAKKALLTFRPELTAQDIVDFKNWWYQSHTVNMPLDSEKLVTWFSTWGGGPMIPQTEYVIDPDTGAKVTKAYYENMKGGK